MKTLNPKTITPPASHYSQGVLVPPGAQRLIMMRDRMLEGHAPAATYVVVSELATPELLVEIEGEAVA